MPVRVFRDHAVRQNLSNGQHTTGNARIVVFDLLPDLERFVFLHTRVPLIDNGLLPFYCSWFVPKVEADLVATRATTTPLTNHLDPTVSSVEMTMLSNKV